MASSVEAGGEDRRDGQSGQDDAECESLRTGHDRACAVAASALEERPYRFLRPFLRPAVPDRRADGLRRRDGEPLAQCRLVGDQPGQRADLPGGGGDDVPKPAADLRKDPFRAGEDAVDMGGGDHLSRRDRAQEGHSEQRRELRIEGRRLDDPARKELPLRRGSVFGRPRLRFRERFFLDAEDPEQPIGVRRRRAAVRPAGSRRLPSCLPSGRAGRPEPVPPPRIALPIAAKTHYCFSGCRFGSRPP